MKFSAASLKSLDYKKLAIDHSEKLAVGLIGLLVVLIVFVPLFTGSFSGFDKTPEKLTEEAKSTLNEIHRSQWPEEEKNKYLRSDSIHDKLLAAIVPVSVADYEPTISVAPPLYQKKEPRKEVALLTMEKPLAVADRALFLLPSTVSDFIGPGEPGGDTGIPIEGADDGIPLNKEQEDLENIPEKFRSRTNRARTGASEGILSGVLDSYMSAGSESGAMRDDLEGLMEMEGMESMMGGEFGMAGSVLEGRGFRYALIRSVFNIRMQRELAAKALSIPEAALNTPTAEFDITGFEIARREYKAGIGPWEKIEDHQILDKMKSMRVLMSMADFDYDPVDYSVSHHEITSPLPPRIVGEWGKDVGHPKINNYIKNTKEGKELDQFLTTFLVEQEEKFEELKKLSQKPGSGFSLIQRNIRGLSNQVFSGGGMGGQGTMGSMRMPGGMNGQSGMKSFVQNIQNMLSQQGQDGAPGQRLTAARKKQIEEDVSRITAAGTLLLFRYFDFDVEPGKTYQYRVRLIFNNPNFERPVSELADPNSRLEPTRNSPWCEATDPVTIPKDTEYFLTRVSIPPAKKIEESRLVIYQWREDVGSVSSAVLDSLPGQYIGGVKETELLDVAGNTFEKQKVEFTSDDVLVDSFRGITVNLSEHADLGLPRSLKGRLRIVDGALVRDAAGNLISIDPISSNAAKKNAAQRLEWQNKPFEYIKELAEAGEEGGEFGLDGGLSGFGGGEMGEEGGKKPPRGRRAKARQKNKLRKDIGSMGMGMGMGMGSSMPGGMSGGSSRYGSGGGRSSNSKRGK